MLVANYGGNTEGIPRSASMPPRGGAVAIVGADAMGKANDKEVSGDAEEVTQRRSEVLRRRYLNVRCASGQC